MKDIVEHLRESDRLWGGGSLEGDAAGEIERLREALTGLVAAIHVIRHDLGTQYPALSEAWVRADSTLQRPA